MPCFGFRRRNVKAFIVQIIKTKKWTRKSNSEARSRNRCCRGKSVRITYFDFVFVTLVVQRARRVLRIIFSSVVFGYFCTLYHTGNDFRKQGIRHDISVLVAASCISSNYLTVHQMMHIHETFPH